MRTATSAIMLLATGAVIIGCSGKEAASADSTGAMSTTAGTPAGAAAAATSPGTATNGDTTVRGRISQVSDSALTLSTSAGDVRVALAQPVKVYMRNRADLSRVTDNVFVGITSVPEPDGTQRATEIHIFPEELRGLGEGSRPMGGRAGGGNRSTMTNGSVSGSRMTNGAARMTNGTSKGVAGGTVTVTYNGGSQMITVPPDVPVTILEATTAKLEPGASVVVVGTRGPDGTIRASRVMMGGGRQRSR